MKSGQTYLSVKDATRLWKIERHTAIRILNEMIKGARAIREGVSTVTRYRIVMPLAD